MLREAPDDSATLSWAIEHLGTRSFGVILLLLGVGGLLPIISPIAGLLLAIPAFQMIRAHRAPVFPQSIANRPVTARKLMMRIIPVLRYLERLVRPRWPTPFETTKRVVGAFVLLLGICLLSPIPLSNVPVSLTIVLVAFAYLEEDGALLSVALVIALVLFLLVGAALWSTVAAWLWLAD